MKKKSILLGSIALGCLFVLASCNNSSNGGSSNNVTGSSITQPSSSTTNNVTGSTTSSTNGTATKTQDASKITLGVTVVYPDGTACSGVKVQWCDTTGKCYNAMATTNENGYGEKAFDSNLTYYAHVLSSTLPSGYTFNPFELKQDKNNLTGTLHLIPVESTTGEGSKANPYVAKVGYNNLVYKTIDSKVYYSVQFTEAGTYTFESLSQNGDVSLGYIGTDINARVTSVSSGGNNSNFKYSINVSESDLNNTYYFIILSNYPETILFSITK